VLATATLQTATADERMAKIERARSARGHTHSQAASNMGVWAPERRVLTVGIALAVTVVAFEALSVATILPIVSRHLGDLRLYGWVFSAFLLASPFGIVGAGTVSDRGRLGRPMAAGLALFAAGLVVGGAAPDMPVLVAGRAIQGLGAGVVPAVAYVAISRGYPSAARPRMFAVLSSAWVVPGLVGPVIAAFVATTVGWRWVFLGLLPVVAVAGVLAVLALRTVPPPSRPRHTPVPYVAVTGVVAGGALALGCLSVIDKAPVAGVGLVAGAAILALSLRRLAPTGTLAGVAGLPATILSRGLITCCFFAGEAYVPYALTSVRHAPTSLSAYALMASTLAWTAGSWTQARFVARVGPRRLVRSGEIVTLCGLVFMGVTLLPALPAWVGIVAWGVGGLGMGLAYAPLSLTTLDRSSAGEEGSSTSALQLFDVLGQAIGTGAAGALVAASVSSLGHRFGVGLAFMLAVAVGLLALRFSVRLPRRLLSDAQAHERSAGADLVADAAVDPATS